MSRQPYRVTVRAVRHPASGRTWFVSYCPGCGFVPLHADRDLPVEFEMAQRHADTCRDLCTANTAAALVAALCPPKPPMPERRSA